MVYDNLDAHNMFLKYIKYINDDKASYVEHFNIQKL